MDQLIVKINGERLEGFDSFSLHGINITNDSNHFPTSDPTPALHLTLRRDPSIAPTVQGFRLIANEDGSVAQLMVELDVRDPVGNTTHAITLKGAYLTSWRHVADDRGTPAEEWGIKSWDVELQADGRNATFQRERPLSVS